MGRAPLLDSAQVEEAVLMRGDGATYQAIAARFGVRHNVIWVALKKRGACGQDKRLVWNREMTVRLRSLWGSGIGSSEIATDLGISRASVMGKIARLGIERSRLVAKRNSSKRGSPLTAMDRDIIVMAYLAGDSAKTIAEEYGIHERYISVLARRAGLLKGGVSIDDIVRDHNEHLAIDIAKTV